MIKAGLFELMKICDEVFGSRYLNTTYMNNLVTYAALDDPEDEEHFLEDICIVKLYLSKGEILIAFVKGFMNKDKFSELFTERAKEAGYLIEIDEYSSTLLKVKILEKIEKNDGNGINSRYSSSSLE